jgi:hypothetical protein
MMTLALPPGGNGGRSYKCYQCDPTDPIKLPDVRRWLTGELGKSAEKFTKN